MPIAIAIYRSLLEMKEELLPATVDPAAVAERGAHKKEQQKSFDLYGDRFLRRDGFAAQ